MLLPAKKRVVNVEIENDFHCDIRFTSIALQLHWDVTKDHIYRMVIVEGSCTMARSSSFKLFIG